MPPDGLSERMATLARDLQSRRTAASTLEQGVLSACELISGCDSAGVSLASRDGELLTVASADELHIEATQLQSELGEGPVLDAALDDTVVIVRDVARDERWPRWRPRAVQDHALRSLVCVRLFTHENRIGTMDFFSRRVDAFTDDDVEEAVAIGAQVAVAYAAAETSDNLTLAIANRTVIGQATGLTMVKYQLGSIAAFGLLKRLSNEQNRKVSVIASELVARWNDHGDL